MVDTKLQPSFIPKKPLNGGGAQRSSSMGFLSVIAVLLFIISGLLAGGAFAYERYLNAHITSQIAELAQKREKFRPDLIAELSRLDTRIKSASELLNNHVALTPFFEFLEGVTLKKVQFKDFTFSSSGSKITVAMSGAADSFATVVLQSDQFAARPDVIHDPLFSGLNADEKGSVLFKFTALLDPKLVSYREKVTALPSQPPIEAPVVIPQSVVGTSTATTTL